MPHEVIVGNHQQEVDIAECWLTALEEISQQVIDDVLQHATSGDAPLQHLATLEITLVDDATSDRVHRDFMNIEGATDVITFHHGEIIIGAEVALRQADEYSEPLLREIFRYLVHGLLHLAGHEDLESDERKAMETAQEKIVERWWKSDLECRIPDTESDSQD